MPVDRSNALVTVTLEGLFIICKNDRINPPRWEIGVPNVSDGDCPHRFSINVFKINGSGFRDDQPLTNFDPTRDIEITNNDSAGLPVDYFQQTGQLDKPGDVGDPNDYRWLVDLEGRDFHGAVIDAKSSVPKHHKLKIFIDGGSLYTLFKTVEQYKRFIDAQNVLILGKLGLSVGIDIPRDKTATPSVNRIIAIKNRGASQPALPLAQEIGVRYEVELKHICTTPPAVGTRTDFDLYYEILQARNNAQFHIITRAASITVPDDPRGGTEPQVCSAVLLGQSLQLPGL